MVGSAPEVLGHQTTSKAQRASIDARRAVEARFICVRCRCPSGAQIDGSGLVGAP